METPEGPNIGLVGHMSSYARINEMGFLETPYLKVAHSVENSADKLIGRILNENISGVGKVGDKIDEKMAKEISKAKKAEIKVKPFVFKEVKYVNAVIEDRQIIAHAGVDLDENLNILSDFVEARVQGHPGII